MIRTLILCIALFIGAGPARAIENIPTSAYNEVAPTNNDIPNWAAGWTQPAVQPPGTTVTTGWNYVGSVNGNSAIYMGYGWVMTCAHVGASQLTLNGAIYPIVPNSALSIGNTDIQLFQVTPDPKLPALKIRTNDLTPYTTKVAMLGWGHANGNRVPTWGWNTATQINQPITPDGFTFVTNDFFTITGTTTNGTKVATNNYQVVIGDSGGGVFTFNTTTQAWELAGMCETNGTVKDSNGNTFNFSGIVQLDTCANQIGQIVVAPPAVTENDTPTMPGWMLVAFGGLLVFMARGQMLSA